MVVCIANLTAKHAQFYLDIVAQSEPYNNSKLLYGALSSLNLGFISLPCLVYHARDLGSNPN